MNLVTDRWIPCMQRNGSVKKASLIDCYTDDGLMGLAVRPHERVALMRLFGCIVYASSGVPADYDELQDLRGTFAKASVEYLFNWKESFELFDGKAPFLQIPNLKSVGKEEDEGIPLTKLNLVLANGNNSTLNDHEAVRGTPRQVDPEDVALWLIAYQNFSTSGRIGKVQWDSVTDYSSSDAPCIPESMLHTLLRGESLMDSIFLNLLSIEDLHDYAALDDGSVASPYRKNSTTWVGQPIWELFPKGFADEKAVFNATRTFMGRLVPIARAIRILSDRQTMVLGRGLIYPRFRDANAPFPKEVTASSKLTKTKEGEFETLLHYEPGHSVWRHLAALSVKRNHDDNDIGGCAALSNINDDEDVDLIVSSISRDQADIHDISESFYRVKAGHADDVWHQLLSAEIQFVEDVNRSLRGAVKKCCGYEDCSLDEKLKKSSKARYGQIYHAEQNFWERSEKNLGDLFMWLDAHGREEAPKLHDIWQAKVIDNARQILREVCLKTSARQMRAYISCLEEFNWGIRHYLGGQKK